MSQAVTIQQKNLDEIISRLDRLTQEVKAIKVKLFEEEPPYGSPEWWEWSDRRAMGQIKRGEGKRVTSQKELQGYLDSLK